MHTLANVLFGIAGLLLVVGPPAILYFSLSRRIRDVEYEISRLKGRKNNNMSVSDIAAKHNDLMEQMQHERRLFPKLGMGTNLNFNRFKV